MKYTVVLAEAVELRSGLKKKNLIVTDERGTTIKDVGMWPDFPGYETIATGQELEGDIVEKGKYKSLYPLRVERPSTPRTPSRSAEINVAMERKNESIRTFQEDKELGIKVAAAMRDATLILTSVYRETLEKLEPSKRSDKIKELHAALVSWYLEQWDETKKAIDNLPF